MEADELIPASAFCNSHHLEISFLYSLQQHGLLETETRSGNLFIHVNQLPALEKLTRLHYELDINLEGMEAIIHLLQRVERMQDEIMQLKTKLKLYEDDV